MKSRQRKPADTPPDLPPENAYSALSIQLTKLQELKGRDYLETNAERNEWFNLTAQLVLRSFGSESAQHIYFRRDRSASQYNFGSHGRGVRHSLSQKRFEARLQADEHALRSLIAQLQFHLTAAGLKRVYESAEQHEYYRDVTACLQLAQYEIFVIDPYLNTEIFDLYAGAITRAVKFRLLGANVPADVKKRAKQYSAGGNLACRSSHAIRDRVLFADDRVWLTGRSPKDAAKKKLTYILEHNEPLMRGIYESIWLSAQVINGLNP